MKKITFLVILSFLLIMGSLPSYAASPKASNISLTVLFKGNKIPQEVKEKLLKQNAEIVSENPTLGAMQIKGSADLIPLLQANPEVEAVSPTIKLSLPATKVKPLTDEMKKEIASADFEEPSEYDLPYEFMAEQWDIKRVTNNGESFKYEKGNHNVVVGIIDSGVDTQHPDLINNLLGGKNLVPKRGDNGDDPTETGDINDIFDRNGHGTHIAGTIAANGNLLGVAPNIGFKAYRIFGKEASTTSPVVAKAITTATDDHVNVISLSVGGYDVIGQIKWTDPSTGKTYNLGNELADYKLYQRAIKYAVDNGVTVVAAAGNEHLNITNKKEVTNFLNKEYAGDGYEFSGASFEAPGSVPGVITVSASAINDVQTSYSNYGPGFIDITAPGGDIPDEPKGLSYSEACLSTYPDGYAYMVGTSMATPKVAAVAALYIAHNDGKMSPSKVAESIYQNAVDIGKVGNDEYFGHGMVQAPSSPVTLPENVEWQHNFGGTWDDGGEKTIHTTDGGFVSVGSTVTFSTGGRGDNDVFIVKMDKDSRTQWTKTLGDKYRNYGMDIIETKDKGYLVVGQTNFEDYHSEIYLAKLAEDGTTEWTKTIGGKGTISSGSRIIKATDGGYIILGTTKLADNDIYVLKMDDTGKVIWSQTYGQTANDNAYSIKSTQDGGYIISGESFVRYQYPNKSDFYVLKLGRDGEKEWEKTYNSGEYHQGFDITQLNDGSYIMVGQRDITESHGYFLDRLSDIYMAKLDPNGKEVWSKIIGEEDRNEAAYGVEQTSDGNLFLVGYRQNENEDSLIDLMKFTPSGDILWEKNYGGGSDYGKSIQRLKNGEYILTGSTGSHSTGYYDSDLFVMKFNHSIE